MRYKPTFSTRVLIPFTVAAITGVMVGAFADSIGWPFMPYALGGALAAWTVQLLAALPPQPAPRPVMIPAEQTVRLRIQNLDARQEDVLRFGIDAERLHEFAVGVSGGKPLSGRNWYPGLFTQPEFTKFIGELVRTGYAVQNASDPRGGVALTAKGRAMMHGLAAPLAL